MRNYIKMRNDTFFKFPNKPTLFFFSSFFSITEENELAENKISELQTQGKKDALAIATQHKQLEESAARQAVVVTEYKDYKDKAETTIVALQDQVKKDEVDITTLKKRISDLDGLLAAGTKEYQGYKSTSEKTANDLNSSLSKVKDEYAQHLKECRLAVEKAATSIANLESTNKLMKDQISAAGTEIMQLKSSLETSRNNELAQESTIARYEAQLLQLDNEYKKHLDACGKAAALAAAAKLASDAEIDKLKRQVASLSGSLEASTNRVTQLEAQGKLDQEEIAALLKRVAELEANKNRLEEQNKKQCDDLLALNQRFNELTQAKAKADKEIEALTELSMKNQTQINQLEVKVKNISEANALANTRIAELEGIFNEPDCVPPTTFPS